MIFEITMAAGAERREAETRCPAMDGKTLWSMET
jgi:hypothetical protein